MNNGGFRHGSLFSGIGGFDLAAKWMGWENIFQVEKDEFCQRVLAKNFPKTRRYGDIHEFSGTEYRGAVDVLTGGFPCQPFSTAGKRRGKKDDRYLWPEYLRVIREIRPAWVVGENVAGIVNMALDQVISDLENESYEVQTFIIPACAVNAPHRRDRVWIVAHTLSTGAGGECGEIADKRGRTSEDRRTSIRQAHRKVGTGRTSSTDSHAPDTTGRRLEARELYLRPGRQDETAPFPHGSCDDVADTNRFNGDDAGLCSSEVSQLEATEILGSDVTDAEIPGLEGRDPAGAGSTERRITEQSLSRFWNHEGKPDWNASWLEVASELCRIPHGLSRELDRVARLKALGNAIVPQVALEIFKAIQEVENQKEETWNLK